MKKIQFKLPEYRQIEINGHIFDIQKADSDIIMKASELKHKYSNLADIAEEDDVIRQERLFDAITSIVGYIDEMLGEGATKKIVDNRPLSITDAIELMTIICKAVIAEYNDTVAEKYEDED